MIIMFVYYVFPQDSWYIILWSPVFGNHGEVWGEPKFKFFVENLCGIRAFYQYIKVHRLLLLLLFVLELTRNMQNSFLFVFTAQENHHLLYLCVLALLLCHCIYIRSFVRLLIYQYLPSLFSWLINSDLILEWSQFKSSIPNLPCNVSSVRCRSKSLGGTSGIALWRGLIHLAYHICLYSSSMFNLECGRGGWSASSHLVSRRRKPHTKAGRRRPKNKSRSLAGWLPYHPRNIISGLLVTGEKANLFLG